MKKALLHEVLDAILLREQIAVVVVAAHRLRGVGHVEVHRALDELLRLQDVLLLERGAPEALGLRSTAHAALRRGDVVQAHHEVTEPN